MTLTSSASAFRTGGLIMNQANVSPVANSTKGRTRTAHGIDSFPAVRKTKAIASTRVSSALPPMMSRSMRA